MRILLVDDDSAVIQALLAILKTLPGHEVRVAMSGEKALENAATLGGIELLITDDEFLPLIGALPGVPIVVAWTEGPTSETTLDDLGANAPDSRAYSVAMTRSGLRPDWETTTNSARLSDFTTGSRYSETMSIERGGRSPSRFRSQPG